MKAIDRARPEAKKMHKWSIVMMVTLVLLILALGSFFFGQPGQLLLKSGFDYNIAWGKVMDDYGLNLCIMERSETGELKACATKHSMFGEQKALEPSEYVEDGMAQLYTGRAFAENGEPKTENLALFAQRVPDIEKYEQMNFEYKALTDIEVSIVDDILIVLCMTRTDEHSFEELLAVAMETAKVGE